MLDVGSRPPTGVFHRSLRFGLQACGRDDRCAGSLWAFGRDDRCAGSYGPSVGMTGREARFSCSPPVRMAGGTPAPQKGPARKTVPESAKRDAFTGRAVSDNVGNTTADSESTPRAQSLSEGALSGNDSVNIGMITRAYRLSEPHKKPPPLSARCHALTSAMPKSKNLAPRKFAPGAARREFPRVGGWGAGAGRKRGEIMRPGKSPPGATLSRPVAHVRSEQCSHSRTWR